MQEGAAVVRPFVFGMICGGVIIAVITARWDTRPEDHTSAEPERVPIQLRERESGESATTIDRAAVAGSPQREEVDSGAGAVETASLEESEPDDDPGQLEGSDAQQQNWLEARRVRLADEPRDVSWSYYAEQALQQFLISHPSLNDLAFEYIECRTTFCQIGVSGVDHEASLPLRQLINDMRDQPWYEFGQTGISGGFVDGKYMLVAELQKE